MSRVLSLHQLSAQTIIRDLCKKTDISTQMYFDMLPLPASIKAKLKSACAGDIICKIIYRIMACNVWLEVQGNYHEERIRHYRETLVEILDELLPYNFWMHGL